MKILVVGGGVMAKHVKESIENSSNVCVGLVDPLGNGDFKNFDEVLKEVDGIIDFSHFSLLEKTINYAIKIKKPLLIATTGHSDKELEIIEKAGEIIPIVKSTNTSLGINVLNKLVETASKLLPGFDIEVIEKHHNRKIDSPSGTANTILDIIDKTLNTKFKRVFGRSGVSKRSEKEIGVHSIRAGNIVGEHTIVFSNGDEIIELKHEALSRKIFSDGAVKIIEFLENKPAKLYKMDDILK